MKSHFLSFREVMVISYHFQIFYVHSVRQILLLCPRIILSKIYIKNFQLSVVVHLEKKFVLAKYEYQQSKGRLPYIFITLQMM